MRLFTFLIAAVCVCVCKEVWANTPHQREDTSFLEDRINSDPHSHHEQFIGEEEAEMFDQLPPHIAKKLLGRIVDRIDEDEDGFVTRTELMNWIEQLTHRKIHENTDFRWHHYNLKKLDKLDWEEYLSNSWGQDARDGKGLDSVADPDRGWTLGFIVEREKRRWEGADTDKDGLLSFEEFKAFTEPHAFAHMKNIVVADSLDDLDTNHDNELTLEEYFDYVLRGRDSREPDYKTLKERYQQDFSSNRDLNKDGVLDTEEFSYWVYPEGFHRPTSEVNFLFQRADMNLDDKLSRKEIVDKHDVFVGSSATDYGEMLKRKKDEL